MAEERSYSKEEIKAILQEKELMKKCELQRQGAIRLILRYGETGSIETMRWLLGKENVDEWRKNPELAEEEIKKSKDRVAEIDKEISAMQDQLL
jgi:DNA helicase TIP49 (TBP-interacting protein)